jgi:DNA-binding response OmpR family regulator
MTAGRPLVLVMEDDPGIRFLLETVLATADLDSVVARDGAEGLLKLRVLEPAVVVLDIMMPGTGGLRVLDELAEHHVGVPVIVITGRPDAAETCRARLGVENVFEKPFDADVLRERVEALVADAGGARPHA